MDIFDRRQIYLRAGTNQYVVGCHLVDRVRNDEEVQFQELDETLQCNDEDNVLNMFSKQPIIANKMQCALQILAQMLDFFRAVL